MLWPAATSMTLMASPGAPFNQCRSSLPSAFMCPMTGSMALRRLSSRLMVGEVMPRVRER